LPAFAKAPIVVTAATLFDSEQLMSSAEDRHSAERTIREQLARLRQEHRDLDSAIAALESSEVRDQLQVTRLKKRKLKLKDELAALEDRLLPDIIA
jgi:hypothetical protein